tara:strand:- start:331 stop:483 length:153 start_codon:yes stop_codon:yes gene_type:complete
MGLFRRVLAAPFYGYAGICGIAAIACPPVLLLGAASLAAGATIDGEGNRK